MGKMQRNKGAAGEREVFKILADELGVELKRDLSQTQDGGCDFSLAGFSCEIKRQETLNLQTWWNQTCYSAGRNAEVPALIYRQSRQPWRVIVPFDAVSPLFLCDPEDINDEAIIEAERFDRSITMLLQPMFTDLLRETMSLEAMAAMREKGHHTTQ